MDATLETFLAEFRLASRWLNDIIDCLIEYSGQAHVETIARHLVKVGSHDINTVRETITRRMNDFCSDAADFKRDKSYDLFQKVDMATYRLRSYPAKPNVIELQNIEFEDKAAQSIWKQFDEQIKKQDPHRWKQLTKEKKLKAFHKFMSQDKIKNEFLRRKTQQEISPNVDL